MCEISVWRQWSRSSAICRVVVPAAEAAAFGAALHAFWALEHAGGKDTCISGIVADHVVLDQKASCVPIPANVTRYAKAYENYMLYVSAVEPIFG